MTVSYCERWDHVAHVPFVPLTEEQARERFAHGPWFTVVLPSNDRPGEADTLLEIEAGLTTVTAVFFDDDTGGELARYVFRRDGDTMLFAEGIEYEAPEDGRRGLSAVVTTREIFVQPSGVLDVVVDRRADDGPEYVDDASVDVAQYREPLPEFGEWAGLARYDR